MIKKLFIYIALMVTIMCGLLTLSITLIDYKKIYQEFVQNTKIDVSSIKESNFKIHKFPIPYLVIDQIESDKKIIVKDVEIRFSIMSLFMLDPQITSLKVGEVIVNLDHHHVSCLNHDQLVSEIIDKNILAGQAKIDKLTFIESDSDIPLMIENFEFVNNKSKTSFSGIVDKIDKIQGEFINLQDEVLFKLNVWNPQYTIANLNSV